MKITSGYMIFSAAFYMRPPFGVRSIQGVQHNKSYLHFLQPGRPQASLNEIGAVFFDGVPNMQVQHLMKQGATEVTPERAVKDSFVKNGGS